MYMCVYIYTHIYILDVCVYVYVCIYMYIHIHIYTYVYKYTYIYVYIYVYIYTHIHIYHRPSTPPRINPEQQSPPTRWSTRVLTVCLGGGGRNLDDRTGSHTCAASPEYRDTFPCRITRVTLNSHVRYKDPFASQRATLDNHRGNVTKCKRQDVDACLRYIAHALLVGPDAAAAKVPS